MSFLDWLSGAETLPRVKAGLAALGCVLLYLEARHPHALSKPHKRRIGVGFVVLGLLAYFHFAGVPGPVRYHGWEMYHYVLGAKYAPELGYTRLYHCTALAEAELGHREAVAARRLRNLNDDRMISGVEALNNPQRCRPRFSASRWEDFKKDVAWFRKASGSRRIWEGMQADHGYNPSPVWTLLGRPLASLWDLSHPALRRLAMLDLLLLAGILGVLRWGYGWRILSVAVLFFGTQAAAEMPWTGGAFLRMDWLFLIVLSLALARKGRYFWAGVALTYAAMLRVFPVVLWAGPVVLGVSHLWRRHKIPSWLWRMSAGAALAVGVLVPSSIAATGPSAFGDFYRHTTMHAGTPITNHMSLKTLFAASDQARLEVQRNKPGDSWTEARRLRLAQLEPAYWAAASVLVIAFVLVVGKLRTPWLAMSIGVTLIVSLSDPSCYYYSVFLAAVPLCRARRSLEMAFLGLGGVGQLLASQTRWMDDRFLALAALYVAFCVLLLFLFGRPPPWSWLRRCFPESRGIS